jgi:hypothetical protein
MLAHTAKRERGGGRSAEGTREREKAEAGRSRHVGMLARTGERGKEEHWRHAKKRSRGREAREREVADIF